MNSCGLSPEAALVAAKRLHFQTSIKPDSVLSLFKSLDFTETHITNLITKCPAVLLADPNKTLKPKIEFFYGLGLSGPALEKLISLSPNLLHTSLQNRIIPCINFLRTFLHTNDRIILVIRRATRILMLKPQNLMGPNISMLINHGVPESNVIKLITSQPNVLLSKPERLSKAVVVVKGMGFDTSSSTFIYAICTMLAMSKSTWEGKLEVYRSLGWSEDDILSAFRMQPNCMLISEKKLWKVVDFFVTKMGWKSSDLSRNPNFLLLSFEKRIVPRCSVLRILMSNDLIKKESISRALQCTEKDFLRKIMLKYQEKIPEILEVYQGSESSDPLS
ncbi:transcription termination factor MTERF8, chloroplastic-like [Tasmannia lanceolata]|uniref:transcription termination factor MTERF8, chloroplastic-like n=1 Tax=Tasmannia lanceolata TaxID=3420 RepID=UPI0040638196